MAATKGFSVSVASRNQSGGLVLARHKQSSAASTMHFFSKATWHEHFTRVLNIPSEYCQVLGAMSSLPPATELDHHPTSEELREAMKKLKRGTAGGRTGILPELLLHSGAELQDRLLLLMDDVW